MSITYPSDLLEDSWAQFVARLLSASTAGGNPLRDLLSMLPSEDLPSIGTDWAVYTDHDSETYIGVGQPDILIKSSSLRIIIENKVSSPLSHNQLQKYADYYDEKELRDGISSIYLYLSPEIRKPTDRRWISISYSDHIDAILKRSLHSLEAQWGQIPRELWERFEELKACRVRGGTKLRFPAGYDHEARKAEWLEGVDFALRETVDLFVEMLLRNYRVTTDTVISSPIAIVGKFQKDGTEREVRLLNEARTYLGKALRKVQEVEEVDMPPAIGIYLHTSLDIEGTSFEEYSYEYPTATGFIITRNSQRFLDDFLEFCGLPPL